VDSFIRDIGSDALIPLEDLSFDALKTQIDAVIARGRAGGEATRKRLMDMEKKNAEAAARLLSE
ncbi:MAG: hypothetical protein IKR93_07510, partial [Firmicutes bacterium]|nr:hypothetical protein [Bacillota bacterium]